MTRTPFDDPDDQVTSPAPRETMAEVQDGRPVVGRWYWFYWEPIKVVHDHAGVTAVDDSVNLRIGRRLEPLTYQHVDLLQARWQRQAGGLMQGQTDALAEMRAQLGDDRLVAALRHVGSSGADPNWQTGVWSKLGRQAPLLVRATPYLLAVGAGVVVAILATSAFLLWWSL